jgi:hypothetical protein
MRIHHLAAALAVAAGVALGALGIGHAMMPTLSSPVPHIDPCHVAALTVDPCAPLDTTQVNDDRTRTTAPVMPTASSDDLSGLSTAGDDTCVLRDSNGQPTAIVPDTDPRCGI